MSDDNDFDEVYIATRESLVAQGLNTEHMGDGQYFFVQKNAKKYAIASPISEVCFLAMKNDIFNSVGIMPSSSTIEAKKSVRALH